MTKSLSWIGNLAALLGIVICAAAFVGRITGVHYLGGVEAMTVFIAGIALLVLACLVKIQILLAR